MSVRASQPVFDETDPEFDPAAYLRDAIEVHWQRRDGEMAAAGYTDDAVLVHGRGQTRTGEALRAWPQAWFDFARDLQITKTLRAFSGNCLAAEWESEFTHPETGERMRERGAEFFWLRGGQVYLHHMFDHTWPDGEAPPSWPAV